MNYEDYLTPAEQEKCHAFAASIHWGFTRESLEEQIVKFEKGGDAARKWADENMYAD